MLKTCHLAVWAQVTHKVTTELFCAATGLSYSGSLRWAPR
jgi:hypothetical protein